MMALALAVIVSALFVVKTKHESRRLVSELEQLRAERGRLNTEWGQLQLEEATLAHPGRIEQLAREKLGMGEPLAQVVIRSPAAVGAHP
jgi:cell division protein FtsL